MRKFLVLAAGVLVPAAVVVAPGLAQEPSPTVLTAQAKVTPNKAGTKKHPQGVKVDVSAHWETPADNDKPVTQTFDVLFPKGSLYNGAKFPSCSENVLARQGLKGCDKGSIMGKGGGVAYADTVYTKPDITVVNGGKNKVFFYTILNNPARVKAPVPGVITKMSGKWAYKLHVEVPRSLQYVAGVPIALRDLHVKAGKKNWLATTGCPANKKWAYSVTTTFNPEFGPGGQASYQDTTACK